MYGKIRITMFVLALVLASCAPAVPIPSPTPSPTPLPMPTPTSLPTSTSAPILPPTPTLSPENFSGKAKIGDFELRISCQGSGEPTVVLERGTAEDDGLTIFDMRRFRDITRTCYYIRPGVDTGNFLTEPRTTLDQVKDLHELLRQTGVPGPYILVGYHLARYNLIVYADQYPEDVAGLITLTGWYPTTYDYQLEKLGPVTADTPQVIKDRIDLFTNYKAGKILTWENHPEYIDQLASEAQVLKVTSLKNIPLTMLVESDYSWFLDVQSEELLRVVTEAVRQSNQDLCKLSSKCQMIIVPETDFFSLPGDKAVEQAIQEMVDLARGE